MVKELIELAVRWIDTKTILLVTIFGGPVAYLFVAGGRLVTR